jgi:hypothetical protein
MTDDNSNASNEESIVDIDNDLNAFEKDFYNKADEKKPVETDETPEDEVEDTGDDAPAPDEDTDADNESDEDPDAEEESEDEEQDDDSEPEPKAKGKGKKSFQERINELTRKAREEERAKIAEQQEKQALLARLEALEKSLNKDTKSESVKENLPQGAPSPDQVNEDGEPKYPLGEFDPSFIRDLTKFTIEEERKAAKEAEAKEAEVKAVEDAKNELKVSWNTKVDEFEEEVPEIREHIADLVDSFQNLDPSYGEYLAMTIMSSDVGPQIMEYLSQNIGEAQKIVGSGPTAATLAIGRLEAKLARPAQDEKPNKKVSAAPEPPVKTTKGRSPTPVRGDTEDLSAFEKAFYNK